MRWEPSVQETEEKLLELAYLWGDVESVMSRWGSQHGEGYASLFHSVQKAYRVEVTYDENDFGDPCTPYVLFFDVTDENARSAAAQIKNASYKQKDLNSFINDVTDTWHSKYNYGIRIVPPGTTGVGVVCRRLHEKPGNLVTLEDVPDEKSASSDELLTAIEAEKDLLIDVATGGSSIQSVNGKYKTARREIKAALRTLSLEDPNQWPDLWLWYKHWSQHFGSIKNDGHSSSRRIDPWSMPLRQLETLLTLTQVSGMT